MDTVDLRSDTVTKPSQAMREAMYMAEVGDDGRLGPDMKGGDPTVRELESLAAAMLGKEEALLVASGTMGNLVALMTHCSRGDEVAVGKTAHIYRNEKSGFIDDIYGLRPLELPDPAGVPDVKVLINHLEARNPRLLCLENSHNYAGGTVLSPDTIAGLAEIAHDRGIPVHLDGARIFNAAAALAVDARILVEPVDSVQFCLSKGLGAPVGSVLVGAREYIRKARERRKLIGGQMRQAGVFAAAGIVALRREIPRLQEDHLKARRLAEILSDAPGMAIDLALVQTNIVKANIAGMDLPPARFQVEAARLGVLLNAISESEIRLVTHRDVALDQVVRAGEILRNFVIGQVNING